jgi:hypothetical protein
MAVIENVAQAVVHSDNSIELKKKENQKVIVDIISMILKILKIGKWFR